MHTRLTTSPIKANVLYRRKTHCQHTFDNFTVCAADADAGAVVDVVIFDFAIYISHIKSL